MIVELYRAVQKRDADIDREGYAAVHTIEKFGTFTTFASTLGELAESLVEEQIILRQDLDICNHLGSGNREIKEGFVYTLTPLSRKARKRFDRAFSSYCERSVQGTLAVT